GEESERVYTLSDAEKSAGRMYGMMQENNKLYYELARAPYANTVREGYFSGNATVRVQSVALNKTSVSLVTGGTVTLKATIDPANATNKNVRWSSSNEAVATVSDGVVTAKAAGTSVITVTTIDGDKKATCTITATASNGNGSGSDLTQEQSTRGFVYRMYDVVLDREPDAGGLDNWVERLDSGESTAVDIVYGFFCSPEYNDKGKTNSELVTDCYNAMLSRDPDPSGYDHWTHCLEIGMTREAIFAGFVNSPEFVNLCGYYGIEAGQYHLTAARDQNYERTYFIYRLYQNCLGRTPDVAGLENWCANLMNGMAGSTVANGFIFSPEYWDKHTDNTEFVSMLYQTILGREGEAAGMSGWIELLNYTSTREKVLNGFLFSEEFAQQCSVAGIQVGERIAEPDEGKAWQYNIQVLALCNQQRKANGLENLVTREDLWRDVAMVRAAECTESFSHTRPNGTDCWTAYTEAGVKNASAENIAAGYSTPKSVVNGWMKSSGHKANILGNSKVLATGYCYAEDTRYGHYWSQNFTR
ncbi:MAG: DUF4214 domain-containing protein, partial [Lachnospiraceae bacterium]|nr:DUF4214 domain-containing protein [Lachnospiraceae bacterium]